MIYVHKANDNVEFGFVMMLAMHCVTELSMITPITAMATNIELYTNYYHESREKYSK